MTKKVVKLPEMKVVNADLDFIISALSGKGITSKPKLLHKIGISRRLKQAEGALKEIYDELQSNEEYKKFLQELEELKKNNADKDSKGKPIEVDVPDGRGGTAKVPRVNENMEKHLEDVAKLRKKYKKAIEQQEAMIDTYDEVFKSPVEGVKFSPIVFSDFIEEKTTYKELFGLYPLMLEYDKHDNLKEKIKKTVTVSQIIGDKKENGLADIDNMSKFDKLSKWDIAVVVAYNMRKIRDMGMRLQLEKEYVEYISKFDKPRIAIAKKHSKLNVNGDPIRTENGFVIEDNTKFKKEVDALEKKQEKVIEAYNKFLEKEFEMEFVKLSDDMIKELEEMVENEEYVLDIDQSEILSYFINE